MEKEAIAKAWDWEKESKKEPWLTPEPIAYYLVSRWKGQGKKDYLDFGCGLGRHALFFKENGFAVKAFDLSSDAVIATKKLGVDATIGDMHHLEYGKQTFDCLFANHVVSHTDRKGIDMVLSEIYRVLRHGGEAYMDLCRKEEDFPSEGSSLLDPWTVIDTKPGPEQGIPHSHADKADIDILFKDFEILTLERIDSIKENGNATGYSHWYLLIRKA